MLRSLVAAGLALSVIGGTGVVALRAVGEDTKGTLDTLNEAFAHSAPTKARASTEDAARWIERYVPGAGGARCGKGAAGWDYVCSFDSRGRRMKIGVVVDATQPVEMSPIVKASRPLAPPADRK